MHGTLRVLLVGLFSFCVSSVFAAALVSGTYKANDKDASLAHVMAIKGEPFSGKPTTTLVFTEQDASGDQRPNFNASLGKFGSAQLVKATSFHFATQHQGRAFRAP
jgi:hypothetical protein